MALIAAACGGDGADETTTTAGSQQETTTTAGAATVPDDPDSGVNADTIKIGWMGDATGPTASAQALNLRGSQAFVEWFNSQGDLFGRQLELVAKDDEFNAESAVSGFRSLVDDEKVLAILQMGGSHISTALMPDVEIAMIPVIGQGQTIDVQIDHPYVFNNIAHYGDQADVAVLRMGQVVGDIADVNVAVIQLELPSGDEWNSYIKASTEAAGGTYVDRILINAGAPDYVASVTRLKQLVENEGVNYAAFHGAPAHGLGMVTEMSTQGVLLPIIGIHGIAGSTIYQEGPQDMLDLVEGIHSFLPSTSSSEGTDLIAGYVAGTDWESDAEHINFTHGWLDMLIAVQAIERAGATGTVNRATMTEALRGSFDVQGMTCDIDWSDFNHSACATPFAWDGAKLVPVGGFADWASALDGEYFINQ